MSWIKIEYTLSSKPEVMALAEKFGISEFEVVGHLVAFWCWVDANMSVECPDQIGTKSGLDRVCGRVGMVDALIEVGWLAYNGKMFSVPNLDRHLSRSAKQRALDTRNKAKKRNSPDSVQKESGSCPEANRTSDGHFFSSLLFSDLSPLFGEIQVPESLTTDELKDIARWVESMRDEPTFFPGSPSLAEKLLRAAGLKRQGHKIADLVSKAIAGGYKMLYPEDGSKPKDKPADQDKTFLAIVRVANQHGGDTNSDRDWRKDPKNVPREWHMALRATNLNWEKLRNDNAFERRRMAEMLLEAIGDAKARLILEPAS